MRDPLDALFDPRRVAVVGASERAGSLGRMVMRNLAGFEGEVVPVTPSTDLVDGRHAYASLREISEPVDLAVVVVPAAAVPSVIEDAGAARVAVALVLSGGFAETGEEGADLQRRMVQAARSAGVRVVGPNCFGVQNVGIALNASMATSTPNAGGDIALVTQSGAYGMAIATLGSEQHLRFSKVYSSGNKADVRDAEVLAYLGADLDSSVLCFFLESLDDGRAFCERARAIVPHKPIIAAKTGRTDAGARAAVSHTAALAGRAEVWRAALEQAGVLVVASGLEMVDVAKALDWQPVPIGQRVGIVTNSGGIGVELTDLLVEEGLAVPELSADLQALLTELLPAHASAHNPVDITPVWGRFAELYPRCLEELAGSGEVDAVVLVLVQRAALDTEVAKAISEVSVDVPVYACWVAPREAQANADMLQSRGVPCFDWPQRTARAVAGACRYGRARVMRPAAPAPGDRARRETPFPPGDRARRETPFPLGDRACRETPFPLERPLLPPLPEGLVPPDLAAEIVIAFGIAVPSQALCHDPEEAAAAAARIGLPVVAKLVAPAVAHKTEAGGVRTGLTDQAAVRRAAAELLDLDAESSVLIQAQTAGVEVVVGGYRDPHFGPVVMVGLGGVLVEVLADTVFRLAPLDEAEADAALRTLRGYPILAGIRGQPPANLTALTRTIAAASRLVAAVPEVAELDLNPVMAGPDAAIAVDVRLVARGALDS